MTPFDRWIAFLFPHEGGESNDPDDHGGRTKFGISQVANPDVDLDDLTRTGATKLAHDRYWMKVNGDGLAALAPRLAIAVADFGFNAHPPLAVRQLQRMVGAAADGVIGERSLALVAQSIETVGEAELVREFNDLRRAYHRERSLRRSQGKYLNGWLRRVDDLDAVLAEIS